MGYNYLVNSPEKVFYRAMGKFTYLNSFSFNGNLSFIFNSEDLKKNLEITLNSPFFNLPLKEKYNLSINFNGDLQAVSTSSLKSWVQYLSPFLLLG